ncbi:hypothetical protein F4859DRAFT_515941 [Xylaria cf. heliscus]|nr:hypothetical protein F4859DRAFT_515941 [Xylaria cf. heliscus]
MYRPNIPVLVIAIAASLPWVNGEDYEWATNQVSATMSAQLKDTAYLDGGILYWVPGLSDGSTGAPTRADNPFGITYTLNFSTPFNSSTNISSILGRIPFSGNGNSANNLKQNYYDGAMLANDHEYALYGGLTLQTAAYGPPDGKEALFYQASDYGPPKTFYPGFVSRDLTGNLTQYITYGGAANAPSENKAWYFGGSRSASGGEIYQRFPNVSINPTNVSNTLITLDLSLSQSEKWTNDTLPPGIPSRASPSVVWVPVGDQGILVVLGGVAYPYYTTPDQQSLNIAQSEKDSPGYMANIDIYDVASGKWYQQPTTGAPRASAMGCAVVASAQDFSSYNIYYYGGFDGLHPEEDFYDDVWVLSLPSFTWTHLYVGKEEHARAGHQCLTPYPDQMVTIGGSRPAKGQGILCLDSILQVFNLTAGQWLSSYDPNKWNEYGVPEMIHAKIGGDYAGGATVVAPSPSWAATELADIFATKYETSKITTYFPYSSQESPQATRGALDSGKGGGGGTPSWVAPVLGVVFGLIFLTAIVVGIMLYRRRYLLRQGNSGTDSSGADARHHHIRVWLNNNNNPEKAPTVTTEDPSSRYSDMRSQDSTPMPPGGHGIYSSGPEMTQHEGVYEMPANQYFFELGDTTQKAELGGKALQQPSSQSSSQAGVNPAAAAAAAAAVATTPGDWPDSPALGRPSPRRTPPPNRDMVVSDLSRINESHMTHLRNLSGGTVSSTSNTAPSPPTTPPAMQMSFNPGPVSPPSAADGHEAGDYMSMHQRMGPVDPPDSNSQAGPSRNPGKSSRSSVFQENPADLGDGPTQPNTR